MTVSTIEIQKLQASEGKVLTNGTAFSSVGGVVYLPENADASNWQEITETEYNEIQKANEEELHI